MAETRTLQGQPQGPDQFPSDCPAFRPRTTANLCHLNCLAVKHLEVPQNAMLTSVFLIDLYYFTSFCGLNLFRLSTACLSLPHCISALFSLQTLTTTLCVKAWAHRGFQGEGLSDHHVPTSHFVFGFSRCRFAVAALFLRLVLLQSELHSLLSMPRIQHLTMCCFGEWHQIRLASAANSRFRLSATASILARKFTADCESSQASSADIIAFTLSNTLLNCSAIGRRKEKQK